MSTTSTDTHETLHGYAVDTWRSMAAMTDPATGLPADNIEGSLDPATRSPYTSPTNIGASMWSTVAARDVGIIGEQDAHERLARTLASVAELERHRDSGMFYNWYDPHTRAKLTSLPDGGTVKPFLSSVDNGWLATALLLLSRADPSLAPQADAIRQGMDFGFYYDAQENAPGGQLRGGFWDEDPQDPSTVPGNYRGRGPDVWYTGHYYGTFNTEPRIASYLGIAAGQLPPVHYFGTYRTYDTDDRVGAWHTYLGQRVFEGTVSYRGLDVVPTWGGSMFEALMVPLFVPEEEWGPQSWAVTHPLYVRAQIEHGLDEAGYGYWGFSPSSDPAGGYREYGVERLGTDGPGYPSDQERTSHGDGVVTPHASFLALRYAPEAALDNLARLRANFDAYGEGGFYDAVAVRSGRVARRYLSLDQGMTMAALGNALASDALRRYVSTGAVEDSLRPVMETEQFGAGTH